MDDQPFLTVERNEFIGLMKFLRPIVEIPSSDVIRRDIRRDFEEAKRIMCQELQVISEFN